MNQLGVRLSDPDPAYGAEKILDLEGLLLAMRRQLRPLIFCMGAGLILGVIYLMTTPKQYTAYTTVLADDGANRIVAEISAFEESLKNEAVLLNQIEVIRSRKVALSVAQNLALHENETFMNPALSLAERALTNTKTFIKQFLPTGPDYVPPSGEAQTTDELSAAAGILQKNVGVKRIGLSSAFLISFETQDPALSAAITNAYADAYMADQLNASFDATERTTIWMQSRLAELEANSRAAAEAVERFRTENGLTTTDGRLLSEQQLAQLHTELSSAMADTARASALATQYRAVTNLGVDETLPSRILGLETQPDSRLAGYQARIAALISRLSEITAERGVNHPESERARAGLNDQAQSAFNEVLRLAEQYAGEEASAKAREDSLRNSVAQATQVNDAASGLQIELRSLEQRAQAVTALYQSFLTRFETIEQQKSFPVSNIRILSSALPPKSASGPGTIKTLALGILFGLFVGACISAIREFRDRYFRTGTDIVAETGLRFLGYLPKFKSAPKIFSAGAISNTSDTYTHAAANPKSLYAETLRSIRIALDASTSPDRSPCLGIVSALPQEGKTTLALNLATLIAKSGRKVLLVDADIRKPSLSHNVGLQKRPGLVEVLVGSASWQDACQDMGEKTLHILPCIESRQIDNTSDLLASNAMGAMLEEARQNFDYVIIDLPPIGPVVDTRAVVDHLDRLLLLAEWGKTPRGLMRQLLLDDPALSEKTIGAVLSRVDMTALGRYGQSTGIDRFRGAERGYYINNS